jgi:hypothetical protein
MAAGRGRAFVPARGRIPRFPVERTGGLAYKEGALGRSLALAVPKLLTALLLTSDFPFNRHSGLKGGWRVTL